MSASRWRGPRNALMLIAALIALWQGLYWWVGDVALASPVATVRYTAKLVAGESFGMHLFDTMRAFLIAFAISTAMGLLVGFWLGFDRLSADTLEPMIVAVYAIPKLTLYPILLLAFGLGLSAKVAFGVLHGVIPIILFTLAAVRNTRPILVKTGHVLGLSRSQMVRWILFPAAIPEIFTGLRVGFALTLIGSSACRDVRLAARSRLPADDGHRPAQRRADHVGDAAHHRIRRRGQRPPVADRSSPPPARADVILREPSMRR